MLLNLGNMELDAGEVDRALPLLEEAAGLFRKLMVLRGWGWPMCTLAEAVLSAREPDEARARSLIEEACAEFGEIGNARGLAQIEALRARLGGAGRAADAALEAG